MYTIEELKNLRIRLGISQAVISKKVGFSHASVSAYETKKREAPYDFLIAYERFLKERRASQPAPKQRVSLREIFGKEGN